MLLTLLIATDIISRAYALSVCSPVDSIFILNSQLIVNDENDDKIEKFFGKLVYDASSEYSGIGLIVFDNVPESLLDDYTLLGLKETLGENTRNTISILNTHLNFADRGFYDKDLMNGDNKIELNDAISTAHKLFLHQGDEYEKEALFIFVIENNVDNINKMEICKNAASADEEIEEIYFVQIDDEEFEIVSIYDCKKKEEITHYDELTDLYEITCPSEYKTPNGAMKINKKVQGIELGSIISCNLITIENECKATYELSPESTILVHDDLNDDMSYEKGYVLMATKQIFPLLPAECYVPNLKIIDVVEISRETAEENDGDDKLERVLRLNVTCPELWEVIMEADIDEPEEGDDSVYVKPDKNEIDPELIQQARNIAIKKNGKRRLFWGSFVSFFTRPSIDVVAEGAKLILGCLPEIPDVSISIPGISSIDFGTIPNGFELTFTWKYTKEFTKSKSYSDRKMKVTGTGTIKLETEIIVYFSFRVHVFGPSFSVKWGWPPVGINDLGVKVYGTFRFTANAKAEGSGSIEFEYEVLSKYIGRKPFIHWIGPVPIVHWPKLVIGLEGSLDSIMKVTADYNYVYQADYEFGARYTSWSGMQLIKSFTHRSTSKSGSIFDAAKDIKIKICPQVMPFKLGLPVKFGTEFYLAFYPYIQFKPSLEGDITVPYSGCGHRVCTSQNYPTGIAIDSELRLAVDAGIEGSNIGWSVSCLFDIPNRQSFTIFDKRLVDFDPWKICDSNGVIRLPYVFSSCCDQLEAGLFISKGKYFRLQNKHSKSCIYQNSDGRFWYHLCGTWSDQYWILDAVDSSNQYFRLKNKQSGQCMVNRKYGYYTRPDGWNFALVRCLGYNDQYWKLYGVNGQYFMLKNKHTGACLFQNNDGRFGVAGCNSGYQDQYWQALILSTGAINGLFIPDTNTPDDNNPFSYPILQEPFYHKWGSDLFGGLVAVLVLLNVICIFMYCHKKYILNNTIKYKTVSMTDTEQYDTEN